MKRTTRILSDHQNDVENAVDRFGDHEGMSEVRVLRWLEQFPDEDLPLAVQVIRSVKYYNTVNLRLMTRQLFQIAVNELREQGYRHLVFVPVGDPGSGSSIVARVLRDLVRGTRHRMLSMVDLSKVERGAIDAIIFLDDFSGTGMKLEKWWETVEPMIRPIDRAVFVGLLVLNDQARQRIEQFARVLAVEELDNAQNIFTNDNHAFSHRQKARLLGHCQRTGCGVEFERGFGRCGLLLAFKHGCPNNSLPVLWYSTGRWRALFKRSAI
jgi:hypothetical protein